MKKTVYLFFILLMSFNSYAQVSIENKNVTAWKRDQVITGKVEVPSAASGIVLFNDQEIPFAITAGLFSVPVILNEGSNIILAKVDSSGTEIISDTVKITLGYKLRPEVYAYAEVSGREVTLHTQIVENPDTSSLTFFWNQDEKNPTQIPLTNQNDSAASFTISESSPLGEYYFNLFTIETDGDTVKSRTFVTVNEDGVKQFNIKKDYAAWIDSAVIYEATPYIFVQNGKFRHITAKIPELVELGINTLWVQPIYSTKGGGQGYDVTNYFGVRSDLGTEEELRELINTAKANGLRVLFDFVPNHSSIHHPYAVRSTDEGPGSYYWDFYQREEDNVPYSQHYHHYGGFINYFWDELPNLNYNNPEVEKWMTEAIKYWIEKFDIDGYRFDAVWGVNARKPQFTKDLRLALKRIKPEILMLAEDKAAHSHVFDERFDVAFDWTDSYSWVSQWVWQTDYNPSANPTIFLASQNSRANLLRNSLNNNGNGYAPEARILRFIGNNDIFPFINHHGLARTQMAAALIFSLNGVPLIYNGQEIGKNDHPYNTWFIFQSNKTIKSLDSRGLFPYYQRLIELKKLLPALHTNNFAEVSVTPGNSAFAFRRWSEKQNVFSIINLGFSDISATLSIPVNQMKLDSAKTYYLTDMLSGEVFSGTPDNFSSFNLHVSGYTTRLFLFADTVMIVTGAESFAEGNVPSDYELTQNYPNPFNPVTTIRYNIPFETKVSIKVYDILGEEITELVNEIQKTGSYKISFDGNNLASGVYLYRLQAGSTTITKKMMLLK